MRPLSSCFRPSVRSTKQLFKTITRSSLQMVQELYQGAFLVKTSDTGHKMYGTISIAINHGEKIKINET